MKPTAEIGDRGAHPPARSTRTRGDDLVTGGQVSRETSESTRRSVRLFLPEYGPVESILGVLLLSLVVESLTTTLLDSLATAAPRLSPDPVTTGMALLPWLFLGTTLLFVGLRQFEANPRTAVDDDGRAAYLAEHRPTMSGVLNAVALVVLGAVTVTLSWGLALEGLRALLPVVVGTASGTATGPSVLEVAGLVALLLGFAADARGLDRVLVGGARELRYQHYPRSSSSPLPGSLRCRSPRPQAVAPTTTTSRSVRFETPRPTPERCSRWSPCSPITMTDASTSSA